MMPDISSPEIDKSFPLPFLWRNKKTKELFLATPWWEIIEPILSDIDLKGVLPNDGKIKIGGLIQVGWLIKNKHNIWFGFGMLIKEDFNDLGIATEDTVLKASKSRTSKALKPKPSKAKGFKIKSKPGKTSKVKPKTGKT